MGYRSCMKRIGTKSGKRSNSGQIPEAVSVPKQSCTGTAQHNATCTGTCHAPILGPT